MFSPCSVGIHLGCTVWLSSTALKHALWQIGYYGNLPISVINTNNEHEHELIFVLLC